MSVWNAPLWKQLATVWVTAIVVEVILFGVQTRRPFEVFWLLPYPNWRSFWPSMVVLFREHPLFGLAVIVVPAVTILATIVLCVNRLVPVLLRPDVVR